MRLFVISVLLAVVGIVNVAVSEDHADPTGTWKWKLFNQSAENTLKLKLDGEKLTGAIIRRNAEIPIEGANYKDGTLNFTVIFTSEHGDGLKIPARFAGRLSGDRIKGEIEYQHPERKILRDWDASRVK